MLLELALALRGGYAATTEHGPVALDDGLVGDALLHRIRTRWAMPERYVSQKSPG